MPIGKSPASAVTKAEPVGNELNKLFPAVTHTTVTGEVITIRPVTFGQLKQFLDSVGRLIVKVNQAGIEDITDQSNWGALFAMASEEIGAITALIIGKDKQWVDDCDVTTDLVTIWSIIIEQNINDFTKKKFQDLGNRLKSVMPNSASSSSIMGGAGATSST